MQEYDTEEPSKNRAERIAQARRRLHKRLGLDGQMEVGMLTDKSRILGQADKRPDNCWIIAHESLLGP